ncbi:sensor histidine kinase [Pseudoneobacillus rhizosphaerae]|uniref:histidine kinase n=1 Tax=Pseudoneobacillus rhizosphaerae TaxID=2880968 RepID=A0A9C7GBU1_9BACI|nr:ATP-binding protein [Pseudoneobacillus rhizosphaerae]CAG9609629.1 Signal transduction histidine-protein kinase BaeS [Pseudoneobacillus rhizosphaerae]
MLQTLRAKILFHLLLVSMSGIVLVSLFVQGGFEESFQSYLDTNRKDQIRRVEEELKKEYKEKGFLTGETAFYIMHEHGMMDQLFYLVYDEYNELIIDSTSIRGLLEELGISSPKFSEDNFQAETYSIHLKDKKIGKMTVFYPIELIDAESNFLKAIQQYILVAVALTILLAFIMSILFSRKLTEGFQKLSLGAKALKKHQHDIEIPLDNLSEEMKELAISFNELARSLAKEERLRKQFTWDLAHELRTPLATLRSQIEAYQDGIWDPTPKRLEQSHEELMRLVRLVNELEKLLAAENPQIKLEKVKLIPDEIVKRMYESFSLSFKQKGVDLKVESTERSAGFSGDKDRVIQILTNIINNALKYTPEGNGVSLSVVEKDEMVGFSIKDEGSGIPEEDIPHVFERFYRGDKSRDRKTGGIGIGLSIVKALVDAHNGKIEVNSSLGKGTQVNILFPKDTL